MKEHRPDVDEEIKRMGNGIANTVLGQRISETDGVTNLLSD